MPEKILLLCYILLLCIPVTLRAQVEDKRRIQDSIAISNAERKLNGDTSLASIPNANTLSAIDSTSPFSAIDSTEKKSKSHSAKKAAFFSAVLPGLGQAYNKKYWKIPIVYAGFAGLSYAVYYTASKYHSARNAYRAQIDENPNTVGSFQGTTDAATLKEYRDYHKKNLTISGFCLGLWYFLNIIDATVDAHLFDFNMSDKLSMHIQPALGSAYGNYAYSGFSYGGQINLIF